MPVRFTVEAKIECSYCSRVFVGPAESAVRCGWRNLRVTRAFRRNRTHIGFCPLHAAKFGAEGVEIEDVERD
jgi:hypothetical protein